MSGGRHAPPTSRLSPLQSAFRFLLEIVALVCWGLFGWGLGGAIVGAAMAVVLPLGAAVAWATFRVPGDESASGRAPVPVRGMFRLVLEYDLLFLPGALVIFTGRPLLGAALIAGVLVHYATTVSRIRWLLAN